MKLKRACARCNQLIAEPGFVRIDAMIDCVEVIGVIEGSTIRLIVFESGVVKVMNKETGKFALLPFVDTNNLAEISGKIKAEFFMVNKNKVRGL